MRNKVADAIAQYCIDNDDGFLIAGDAGFGVWCEFKEKAPHKYINPGINEQASTGLAAGMALSGHKVFMYNIIPFALYRNYEQIRNDICYQKLPVVIIGIGSGITYAPAGMTHYAVEDIALARTLPNLEIFSPSDSVQALAILDYALTAKNPVYMRIAKKGELQLFDQAQDIHKPHILNEGSDISIIFHGSISDEAVATKEILKKKGFSIGLISAPRIDKIDVDSYNEIFLKYKRVYVLEEHFINGGLGTVLQESGYNPVKIGIQNHFIHDIGDANHLRNIFGISASKVAEKILKDING